MRKNKLAVSSLMFSGALVLGTSVAWPQSTGSDQPRSGQSGSIGSGSSSMSGQMSQDQIKKIQQALKDKGHDPGPIDGNMNSRTLEALRAFQKSQNITVTGTLDSSTAAALGVTAPSSSATGAGSSSSGKSGSSRDSSGGSSSGSSTGTPDSSTRGSSGAGGSSGSGSRSGGSSGAGAGSGS